jgi:predicted AlkP superfamily phosphohydrolase/phosphomutase
MVKVLVIGIDGASWNFIYKWIEKGKLPTFKKLMENGVWGDLESCVYYFTSPAWKCYSTGKNPGKLGAFSYWSFDKNTKELSLNLSTSFKSRDFWDILGNYGYKCGIVNMPLTYPPKKINGVLITGFPALEHKYTYPPELEKELKRYNYRVGHIGGLSEGDRALSEIRDMIKKRFLVSAHLLEKSHFDFFQVVIFYIDKIQHDYWKPMEENDQLYGSVIQDFWEFIDREMAKLLDLVGDCYVFIVSDHGFNALRGVFRLNVWLKEKGYLHLKRTYPKIESIFSFLEKIGVSRRFIVKMITSPNLMKLLRFFVSGQLIFKVGEKVISGETEMGITSLIENVDWEKTNAICVAENCLYILTSNDYRRYRDRLIEEIKDLRDPRTGEKIVKNVRKREDVYRGDYLHLAPDLIINPEDGYRFYDGIRKDLWDFSRKPWSGYHRLHGMFLAKGPTIKKGVRIDGARIYDVAPTILHIFGIPIPEDMDGHVLREIFEVKKESKSD